MIRGSELSGPTPPTSLQGERLEAEFHHPRPMVWSRRPEPPHRPAGQGRSSWADGPQWVLVLSPGRTHRDRGPYMGLPRRSHRLSSGPLSHLCDTPGTSQQTGFLGSASRSSRFPEPKEHLGSAAGGSEQGDLGLWLASEVGAVLWG